MLFHNMSSSKTAANSSLVRAAVARKEKAEIQDRKPSPLAAYISRFAPGGLEDK
jgi:hypothetical protein